MPSQGSSQDWIAGRGKKGPASAWDDLSDRQKKRYLGAGANGTITGRKMTEDQVRRYYLSGKSLTAARRGRNSREAVTQRQRKKKTERAAWLPSAAHLDADTAAALTAIGSPPSRWKSVTFVLNEDGTVTMTIQRKGRNRYGPPKPIIVTLPDVQASRDVGRWIQTLNHQGLQVRNDMKQSYESPGPKGRIAP